MESLIKKLHALGINLKGPDAQHDTHEGEGSRSNPSICKQKLKTPGVIQELAPRLPPMTTVQEEGFLTDWKSPKDENHEEPGEGLREDTINAWAKKCAHQQEQMKFLTGELERLKKQKQISEAEANEGEIKIPDEDGKMEHFITKGSKGHKFELPHTYIDESSPFSADIQTDPVPRNFKTISYEYQGKGDLEEHLIKFESLCLLHQYLEGFKCRVFLTTLSGTAQH